MKRKSDKRSAVTLVELLVVVGILTLLVALVMAGVAAVRARQQNSLTEATVFKLQEGIDNLVHGITDQARKDRKDKTADFQSLVTYCDNDEDRAEALLMLLKLRHTFPTTIGEAQAYVRIPSPSGGYVINWPPHKAYTAFGSVSINEKNLSAEQTAEVSAELLYAGLSGIAISGNAFASDDATASAQIDWTVSGVNGLVYKDGWNRPIGLRRFYENPQELNAAPYTNAKDSNFDPFDTQNKLRSWNPTLSSKKSNAQSAVGTTFNGNNKVLMAFSLGEDKRAGTEDDIFGYRLRKIGGRGTK